MKTISTLTNGFQKFLIVAIVSLISVTAKSAGTQPGDSAAVKATTVQATAFAATLNNSKADLKWTAAKGSNISHFVIERSTDGVEYHDAAVVFTFEDGSDKANYNFSDKINDNMSGIVYYRICTITEDGQASYSATQFVIVSRNADQQLARN